jgi:hypothetical protein
LLALAESVVSRSIEGVQFLPRYFHSSVTAADLHSNSVEIDEKCILELAPKSYSKAGVEDWNEYSQTG